MNLGFTVELKKIREEQELIKKENEFIKEQNEKIRAVIKQTKEQNKKLKIFIQKLEEIKRRGESYGFNHFGDVCSAVKNGYYKAISPNLPSISEGTK